MAPWPLKNDKLAKTHLHAAHRCALSSRRNCYYLGVLHYRLGDYRAAAPYFRAATKAPCNSPSERDFGEFMRTSSIEALQACEAELS